MYMIFSRFSNVLFVSSSLPLQPTFPRVVHTNKRPKYNDHIVIALRFVESSSSSSSSSQRRLHSAPVTTQNYSAITYDERKTDIHTMYRVRRTCRLVTA